jgi:hypothetical protein
MTQVLTGVLAMVVLLSGCHEVSEPTSQPSAQPSSGPPSVSGPPATPAIVQVMAPAGLVAKSPVTSFSYRLRQPLGLREIAGAAANVESFRIRIVGGDTEEIQLLGRESILGQIGSLRLDALSTRSITLAIDFNTLPADRMTGELSYLGDDGLTRSVFVDLHPEVVSAVIK